MCLQQNNGSDCGIHIIHNGLTVIKDEDISTLAFDSLALQLEYVGEI